MQPQMLFKGYQAVAWFKRLEFFEQNISGLIQMNIRDRDPCLISLVQYPQNL